MKTKISTFFKNVKWHRYINYIAISIAAIIFSVWTLAGNLAFATTLLLEQITLNIVLAVSLSLVVGFLGELSLGHAGFMCIGAYIGGRISTLFIDTSVNESGLLSFVLSMIAGALIAAVFGFVIGLPALRLKGDYLAIVTLAFGEIVKTIFENTSVESFGGPMGLTTPRMDTKYLFIIGFVLVLITVAIVQNLIKSKHGRAITAIRDNEIAAKATGINITKYKLTGFIISAALAGAAGVFYSFSNYVVTAKVFDYNYSIEILVMVVLGGMGSISGSIISATLITFLNIELQNILTGDLAVLKDIIYSLILILIVIYNNAKSLKPFRDKYNLKSLWAKIFKKDTESDSARWDVVPTKIEMNEVLSTDFIVNESTKMSGDKGGKSDE